tara:strand:- start:5035 stop:5424 length:390 start_codon:yes stop_codon:yes gene_type:complete
MFPATRLDPFSARILAIHQQTKRPTGSSEHAGPVAAAAVAEYAEEQRGVPVGSSCTGPEAAPVVPLASTRHEIDTGCAECGGKGESTSPVDELRQEISDMKTRIAALEEKVAQLDADTGLQFRSAYAGL